MLTFLAGYGVLWGWFNHRPGEEHKGEPAEGRLDCLHFQRDPAGKSTLLYGFMSSIYFLKNVFFFFRNILIPDLKSSIHAQGRMFGVILFGVSHSVHSLTGAAALLSCSHNWKKTNFSSLLSVLVFAGPGPPTRPSCYSPRH